MRAAELELDTIRVQQDGRVLTAWIEDPPYSFMTAQMQRDLDKLTRAVDDDASVGAVIVTGGVEGRYITHFDIGEILATAERFGAPVPAGALRSLMRAIELAGRVPGLEDLVEVTPIAGALNLSRFNETLMRIMRSGAVYIAAIGGPCGGGGLESAVCFDVRIAARDAAVFMLPELLIGLTTTFGGQRLTQLVGPGRALEILLEGRAYSAQEALELGLVGRVVPDHDLLSFARETAARYATRNRDTIAAQKRIFNEYALLPPDDALRAEGATNAAGVIGGPAPRALRAWLQMQHDGGGDSTFLTNLDPWRDGAVIDLNDNQDHEQ
jgi:enoyl-CoA hydratase/carnithine racemase